MWVGGLTLSLRSVRVFQASRELIRAVARLCSVDGRLPAMAAFAIAFAALFTLPGLNSERQLQPSGETASAAGGPSAPDWSTVPIFITNLAGAKDRLQVMSEVMSATSNLGFGSACRVPGVNGSAIFAQPALDRIVMKAAFNHSPTWSDPVARTPGAVGCALSHTRSLKRIVDNGIPIGILMEDDVVRHWGSNREPWH